MPKIPFFRLSTHFIIYFIYLCIYKYTEKVAGFSRMWYSVDCVELFHCAIYKNILKKKLWRNVFWTLTREVRVFYINFHVTCFQTWLLVYFFIGVAWISYQDKFKKGYINFIIFFPNIFLLLWNSCFIRTVYRIHRMHCI